MWLRQPVEYPSDPLAQVILDKDAFDAVAEVGARLKLLYRRYNRGASSLDAKMRVESETMLDAIVEVREKFFGEI